MKKNKNLTSLDQFIDNEIGATGSKKRTKFESGYETFKLGVLIQEARHSPTYTTPGPSHNQSHSLSGK
jgi:hypothetical protein